MGIYGTRDGIFKAKRLEIEDKIIQHFVIPYTATVGTATLYTGLNGSAATARTFLANASAVAQPPYPATIRVTANIGGRAAGTDDIHIVGYDAQGKYRSEDVQVAATAAGFYDSNYAYCKVVSLTPYSAGVAAAGTSSSICVGFTGTVGLPYPIATSSDVLGVNIGTGASSDGATTMPTIGFQYDTVQLGHGDNLNKQSVRIVYLTKLQEK